MGWVFFEKDNERKLMKVPCLAMRGIVCLVKWLVVGRPDIVWLGDANL